MALIVLMASVVVPIASFIAIAVLAIGRGGGRCCRAPAAAVAVAGRIIRALVDDRRFRGGHPVFAWCNWALRRRSTPAGGGGLCAVGGLHHGWAAQHFDPRLMLEHDRPPGPVVQS